MLGDRLPLCRLNLPGLDLPSRPFSRQAKAPFGPLDQEFRIELNQNLSRCLSLGSVGEQPRCLELPESRYEQPSLGNLGYAQTLHPASA